jgi:translocation protein SEC72
MASSDDALETYTHLPIHLDPQTKQLEILSSDKSLQEAIANINKIHTTFKSLETPNNIPPPPMQVNQKRSAQIAKLRDSARASHQKGQKADAVRLLGVAVDMAAGRPSWEAAALSKEELAFMYASRAGANGESQNWPEALVDAECSIKCKPGPGQGPNGERTPGNARAYILGAQALMEMARWQDAAEWLERAVEIEGKDGPDGAELMRRLMEARRHVSPKD